MKDKITFLTIMVSCLLTGYSCFSQGETANWLFGDGNHIKFQTGKQVPVNVTPGGSTGGFANPTEVSAAISDCSGNLLFYTDGMSVWSHDHSLMSNGDSIGGHWSAAQSSIIVPYPNRLNKDLYYVFTTDAYLTSGLGLNGLAYSIVDISANGGFGSVTSKNNTLLTPANEYLTAVHHANGKDVWVIGHGNNNDQFYAYLVSSMGLDTTPVISNAGPSISVSGQGIMKASPDGSFICVTDLFHTGMGYAFLSQFNDTTGQVSNAITLPLSLSFPLPYGNEFSPSSNRLYIMDLVEVHQFDLTVPYNDIPNTKTLVSQGSTVGGSFHLAPDGKIYIADGSLSVINEPDSLGLACDFQKSQFPINYVPGNSLCNFIQSYLKTEHLSAGFDYVVQGNTLTFTDTSSGNVGNYSWDFGDSASASNISLEANPSHIYSSVGQYTVRLIVSDSCNYRIDTTETQITVSVFVSNEDVPEMNKDISVYPNPFNNKLFISLMSSLENDNGLYSMKVFDMIGRCVYHSDMLTTGHNEIDLSFLDQGQYAFIINEDGIIKKKGFIIKDNY